MIELRECNTRKEQKRFIDFPLALYKDNPYFVPPLYADEKSMFKKNYYYRTTSDFVCYNAYQNGKMVGRIQGILQKAANLKWNQQRVRFTRFDCVDDQKVANALFDKVKEWAKEKKMKQLVGPLGFSDFEREGLLIEGFDYLSTFEEQYNYPYYQKLIENYGFRKEVDWTERRLYKPETIDPVIARVSKAILTRNNFHIVEGLNINQIIKRYGDQFFDLVDETYNDLYGTVPFIPAQRKDLIRGFKVVLSPFYVRFIVDGSDKLVALGLCFPAIGKDLQKSGGKLTLPAIFKVLKTIHNPKTLDLGLIGVSKKFANTGVAIAIFYEMMKIMKEKNIEFCETNLNLETNDNIQNNWHRFKNKLHKRRRSYLLDI